MTTLRLKRTSRRLRIPLPLSHSSYFIYLWHLKKYLLVLFQTAMYGSISWVLILMSMFNITEQKKKKLINEWKNHRLNFGQLPAVSSKNCWQPSLVSDSLFWFAFYLRHIFTGQAWHHSSNDYCVLLSDGHQSATGEREGEAEREI